MTIWYACNSMGTTWIVAFVHFCQDESSVAPLTLLHVTTFISD